MSEMTNRRLPRVLLSLIAALLLAFVIGYFGVSGFGEEPFGVQKASAQQSATGNQSALQELPKMSAATASNSITYDDNTPEDVAKTVWRHSSNVWANLLARAGYNWVDPELYYVYNDPVKVPYGCGNDQNTRVFDPSMGGPFYCPKDHGIYYDVYEKVKGHYIHHYGDAAVATIVAHEMGHHVQEMLSIRKPYGFQVELQADCFAGVEMNNLYWDGALEKGDLQEALNIMYAVGDDLPLWDPNHHGTSAERQQAFYIGYNTGDPSQCEF